MANRVLEYIIKARNVTGKTLKEAESGFSKFRSAISKNALSIVKKLFSIKAAIIAITAVAAGLTLAIKEAFAFEKYETQFKILLGSLDAAKQRMEALKEFSASTPFQFGEIAETSRQLHVFSDGALGAEGSLKLVGDAAAVAGVSIKEVGFWVGRAYSAIASGRPFGEAAARLQEMALLSGSARGEIEDLTAAGASNAEVWAVLERELKKAEGGMIELSKTGEGLTSTLKDNWKQAVAAFGEAFTDLAKDNIKELSDALVALKEDGSITEWAETGLKAVEWLVDGIKILKDTADGMKERILFIKDFWGAIYGQGNNGVGIGDAGGEAERKAAERAEAKRREEERKKVLGIENAAKREEAKVKSIADEEAKKIAHLASEQEGIDARNAVKKAEVEEKERIKVEKAVAKERDKLTKELIKMETDERKSEQKSAQKSLGIANNAETIAMDRLDRATAAAQTAWDEYKNPELFKARIEEEKRETDAKAQFEKDAKKLRVKLSMGFGKNLSDSEQAVQRVLEARSEEQAALEEVMAIRVDVAEIKENLNKLLTME